jgi:F420H(2)-dependent quinone reductase
MVGNMNLERSLLRWLVWPLHRAWLSVSSGRIGTAEPTSQRMGTLVITTTGRKSGNRRSAPVYFMRDADRLVVVASNVGEDRDPAWYLNLIATPDVEIQMGRTTSPVRARDATDGERSRLWPELVRRNPGYARYERRTKRQMPLVILEAR